MSAIDPSTPRKALTPAGLQSRAVLARRRLIAAAVNGAIYVALLTWLASILGAGGWGLLDALIFLCFAVAAPWSVLGVWNACLGLWLLRFSRDAMRTVAPHAAAGDAPTPLDVDIAVTMTMRNEDARRAFARFRAVKASVEATGQGARFGWFALSDTSDPAIAAAEEAEFAAWRAGSDANAARLFYRRRDDNAGFKAGNLRDFCLRWGGDYEFMIPLDADSLMDGDTILRMARVGQAWPRIGILQSLVVGAPAKSGFARVFQFGMRHGMRPYTMGSAWWAGDCGPFWGHNALVRVKPFLDACELPALPGKPPMGGAILSHDQVEAALMRRAGFEARVLPVELGSFEDNPPHLLEFIHRDLRWCQGNLQYVKLRLPGLQSMSRFQLIWAIMMFVGLPAWTSIIAMGALEPLAGKDLSAFPAGSAIAFYLVFLSMYLAPKLCGFLDVALTPGGLARYGGGARFALGCAIELVFSFLLGASTTLRASLFMLGLPFGFAVGWSGQTRDAQSLTWSEAWRALWPQTVFGSLLLGLGAGYAPVLALWSLPLTLGYVLAAPFAVLTASSPAARFLHRWRLCASPEEFASPAILNAVETAGPPRGDPPKQIPIPARASP